MYLDMDLHVLVTMSMHICMCLISAFANQLCIHIGRTFRVRLVNGPSPNIGSVEVYTNSTGGLDNAEWGTICDDDWDIFDARVACHMMGFPNAVAASVLSHTPVLSYVQRTGPIWLNNINCYGYESDIFTCGYVEIGNHSCQHLNNASAECLGKYYVFRAECTFYIVKFDYCNT